MIKQRHSLHSPGALVELLFVHIGEKERYLMTFNEYGITDSDVEVFPGDLALVLPENDIDRHLMMRGRVVKVLIRGAVGYLYYDEIKNVES